MEKILVILAAALVMLSFSMVGFAYGENMAGTTGTSHQTMMDRQAAWGPVKEYTGEVVWVEPNIHTIMVRGRNGSKIFNVSGATIEGGMLEAHHFVTVRYTGSGGSGLYLANGERIASSIIMVPRVAWGYEH